MLFFPQWPVQCPTYEEMGVRVQHNLWWRQLHPHHSDHRERVSTGHRCLPIQRHKTGRGTAQGKTFWHPFPLSFNSFASTKCGCNFKLLTSPYKLLIYIFSISCERVLNWMNILGSCRIVSGARDAGIPPNFRADSRFALSQWERALHCNDVSHWLGSNLESALNVIICSLSFELNKSLSLEMSEGVIPMSCMLYFRRRFPRVSRSRSLCLVSTARSRSTSMHASSSLRICISGNKRAC